MSFKFKITKIDAPRHAGVGVLDGQILTGQDVLLVHKDKKLPLFGIKYQVSQIFLTGFFLAYFVRDFPLVIAVPSRTMKTL